MSAHCNTAFVWESEVSDLVTGIDPEPEQSIAELHALEAFPDHVPITEVGLYRSAGMPTRPPR